METISLKEDHISQIPALQMIVNLNFKRLINKDLHNKAACFIMQMIIIAFK